MSQIACGRCRRLGLQWRHTVPGHITWEKQSCTISGQPRAGQLSLLNVTGGKEAVPGDRIRPCLDFAGPYALVVMRVRSFVHD
jgi:hypothetical protein